MTRRGLFLPTFDVLSDPRLVADVAVEAEAAGWDGVFVWDHLLYAEPVVEIADPWICCAAIATATSRVVFGPMVTPLSRRRPQVLARQAASLHRLSGGRLVLGFGLGDDGRVGELSRFGEELDATVRAARLDEGLTVLRGLLSGDPVTHEGPHFPVRDVTFRPSATAAQIPFWIGGRWPNKPPLRRAARHQGAFLIALENPADLGAAGEVLTAARAAAGHDMESFDLVVQLGPGADVEPWSRAGATWVLTQLGPYRLDLDEVLDVVRAGP